MRYFKSFDNGLRLIINKMDGFVSVSCGVLVKTGSINESESENGISHFIEHVMFKGTEKRTAFEISLRSICLPLLPIGTISYRYNSIPIVAFLNIFCKVENDNFQF